MDSAAFSLVGESVSDPAKYYQNNVAASLNLLEAMRASDVKKIVFSSTTATYGVPDRIPITEQEKQEPINPYGFCKIVIEHALADYAYAYGFAYAAVGLFQCRRGQPRRRFGRRPRPRIPSDSHCAQRGVWAAATDFHLW